MNAIKIEGQHQKMLRAQQFSDALIPIEEEAYALAAKEFLDPNRYINVDFDKRFNYHFAKLIIANKDTLEQLLGDK